MKPSEGSSLAQAAMDEFLREQSGSECDVLAESQLAKRLRGNLPVILLLNALIVSWLVLFFLWPKSDQAAVVWAGYMVFCGLLLAAVTLAMWRMPPAGLCSPIWRWAQRATVLALASGWAAASLTWHGQSAPSGWPVVDFGVLAIAVLCSPLLAVRLELALIFLTVSLVPLIVQSVLGVDQIHMGLLDATLLGGTAYVCRRLNLASRMAISQAMESRVAKEQTERLRQSLKEEIKERWKLEQELKQAMQSTEQAEKAKGDFLATISHEFRTPLNGILGTLELMEDQRLDDEAHDLLQTARLSADSLLTIVTDTLDFSRAEMGNLKLEEREFDLRRTIKDVTGLMARRADEKGLELKAEGTLNLPPLVYGDPVRVRQILINLIDNAIKFTQKGSITVRAQIVHASARSLVLRLEVEDTGSGISAVDQQRIFASFTQADGSLSRAQGGAGLGLAMVKNLVELMSGQTGVQSKPGVGSLFWLTLLLGLPKSAARGKRDSLDGTRVLLVGRTDQSLTSLQAMLKNMRVSVDTADDAGDALIKLRYALDIGATWAYEAVIVSAQHHGRGVDAFLRSVRADRQLAGMVVIQVLPKGVSAENTPKGMADVLLRSPVQPARLFDALAENTLGNSLLTAKHDSKLNEYLEPAHSGDDRSKEPSRTDAGKQQSEPEQGQQQQLLGHLLLAEDNKVNRKVIMGILDQLGMAVDVAENGLKAVEAAKDKRFDLILMDVQMPEMDGLQATSAIRAAEAGTGRHTPIIAVTANAMEGDREKCLVSGMDDYLPKPINKAKMQSMLHKWLPKVTPEPVMPSQTAPAETEDSALVDNFVLDELRDILGEGFADLVRTYLSSAPDLLKEVRAAIEKADDERLRIAAHTLKSTSANLGALQLSALATEMELLGRNGTVKGAASLYNQALANYRQVKEQLKKLI